MRAPLAYCLAAAAVLSAQPVAPPTGSIAGKVVDANTGRPLTGAKLRLTMAGQPVVTNATGDFVFRGLEAGDHHISVEADDYASVTYPETPSVRLRTGQSVNGLMIRLSPEATITGMVTNASGQPVAASVSVMTAGRFNTHVASLFSETGAFALRRLPAGSFIVCATARTVEVCHSDAADRAKAQTLVLSQGQQLTGINIVAREQKEIRVRGRFAGVVPAFGMYQLTAMRLDAPKSGGSGGRVERDGTFALLIPFAGRYRLGVLDMPGGPGQPVPVGMLEITIPEQGLDGVVIPATPVHSIRARSRWAQGVSATGPPPVVEFSLNPLEGLGILQHAKREADGSVVAPRVSPDRYSFLVGKLPARTYVKSIHAGGVEITSRGLDLITGAATEVEFLIASNPGLVSGRVLDAAGNPVAGARVSFSRHSPHRPERELWSHYTLTPSDGEFDAEALAPGEYRVYCSQPGREAKVQSLRISAGSRQRLEIVLP